MFSSALFGFWHVIGPVRNYMEGTTGPAGAAANAVMLLCTSALVGFKFAMLTELTGNLYTAMGDHFVNNTIVNLLRVVSESGADEWMVVRVSIAQSLSFAVVLALYIRQRRKNGKEAAAFRKEAERKSAGKKEDVRILSESVVK